MSPVFYRTNLSFALVNLKPLLPGHVLVSPRRVVPRIHDLSPEEITDLFLTVQKVSVMIERVFNAGALNVAIQDGEAAGQSVKHVHTHIIPRTTGDLDKRGGSDAIYEMLDSEEGNVGASLKARAALKERDFLKVDQDERKPRSEEEMNKEAEWLANEMRTGLI
ncbi:MAG: hypothetical protein M1814_002306 [Vezdaea aestivalis]|nr:MAG: hypothetical protein M1814_002306 [Vezdaea aestivalis]